MKIKLTKEQSFWHCNLPWAEGHYEVIENKVKYYNTRFSLNVEFIIYSPRFFLLGMKSKFKSKIFCTIVHSSIPERQDTQTLHDCSIFLNVKADIYKVCPRNFSFQMPLRNSPLSPIQNSVPWLSTWYGPQPLVQWWGDKAG